MFPPVPPSPLPPPTHTPLDYGVLMPLMRALGERAVDGGKVTYDDLSAVAAEADAPLSHVYVALGMHPGLYVERRHPIGVAVCTGRCQLWGSLDLLEAALLRATGAPVDVVPRGCLNLCDYPPAIALATPDGVASLPRCSVAALDDALTEVLSAS